jgi:hypothetical protein
VDTGRSDRGDQRGVVWSQCASAKEAHGGVNTWEDSEAVHRLLIRSSEGK